MGLIKATSNPTKLQPQTAHQGFKPLQALPPQHFSNPFYERSQRSYQQKQYIYQLIAHLRQIKIIFQEFSYQRFYGGRDGYYITYPTQLVNLEHSFLATLEGCPGTFVDLISLLQRIDTQM